MPNASPARSEAHRRSAAATGGGHDTRKGEFATSLFVPHNLDSLRLKPGTSPVGCTAAIYARDI